MKPLVTTLLSEAFTLAAEKMPRSIAEERYIEQSRVWLAEGVAVSNTANQLAHKGQITEAQELCAAYNAKKPKRPTGRPRNSLTNKTVEVAVALAALPETIQIITGERRKKILNAAVDELVARHVR